MKVATIGFFDGVHRGHQYVCRQLKTLATKLGATAETQATSLVVTFRQHPQSVLRRADAPKLLTTNAEKSYFLENICGVDEVIFLDFTEEFAHLSAREFMSRYLKERFGVTHLLVGYDHHFGRPQRDAEGRIVAETFEDYERYGKEIGIELVLAEVLPSDEKISSSAIRRQILLGDVAKAGKMLGHDFRLTGVVVRGHQEGRKIGFPTANALPTDTAMIVPASGVYVTSAYICGRSFPSITNIGHRPTFNNGPELSVESHFLEVKGLPELYDETIMIDFHERLREEQTFDTIEALQQQIGKDVESAIQWHREHAQNMF